MFEVDLSNNTNVVQSLHLTPVVYSTILSYHVLVTCLSLVGNFLVLYGTHRYNAINIDAVSLIFIKFLAVTDISIALMSCLPVFITLVKTQWVLGKSVCFVLAYLIYIPGIAQAFIILEFTLYKLVLLLSPMASLAGTWTSRKMTVTFSVTYLLTTLHTACSLMLSRGASYSPAEMACSINKERPEFQTYGGISIVVISFAPPILMVIINMALLVIARRSQKTDYPKMPSIRAIVITLCISWIYVISTVPKGVMNFLVAQHQQPPTWLILFQKEVFYLNSACNPIVYTAVNSRFRDFVMRRLSRKMKTVKLTIAYQFDEGCPGKRSRRGTEEVLLDEKKQSEEALLDDKKRTEDLEDERRQSEDLEDEKRQSENCKDCHGETAC